MNIDTQVLFGALEVITIAISGWTLLEVIGNGKQIARLEERMNAVESRERKHHPQRFQENEN